MFFPYKQVVMNVGRRQGGGGRGAEGNYRMILDFEIESSNIR